jgi:choline dehydrogenase-like flavoprotein
MTFSATMLRAAGAGLICLVAAPAAAQTDAAIRQQIIRQSIASYPGNCPCPYNSDRAGRRCGGRSAYSRPGGQAPKCFPEDVSAAEVRAHKARK